MSQRTFRAAVRRVLGLALVLALLLAPSASWTSHHPLAAAEAARTAELAIEIDEHGHAHAHAEDPVKGSRDGHAYGHDQADHNHETPWSRVQTASLMPQPARNWQGWPRPGAPPETSSRLERPPRPLVAS